MKNSIIAIIAFLFLGCFASNKISYWKTPIIYSKQHSKILVAGIIQDTLLRRQMEEHLTGVLRDLGYNAVSALDEFGFNGLHKLSQEQTYVKLCNSGIDAVMTIVLVDEAKEKQYQTSRFKTDVSTYYFNRIWNYFKIQTNQLYLTNSNENLHVFWESVFFDLSTLEPLYAIKTKPFASGSAESLAQEYGKIIVKSMVENKILHKQPKPDSKTLKPF